VYNQAQSNKQPYQPSSIYQPAQQHSQTAPSFQSDYDVQAQMLKLLSEMDQTMNSHIQTVDSHSQAIAKIEAQMGPMVRSIAKSEVQMG
jgi:hypothetical protein